MVLLASSEPFLLSHKNPTQLCFFYLFFNLKIQLLKNNHRLLHPAPTSTTSRHRGLPLPGRKDGTRAADLHKDSKALRKL